VIEHEERPIASLEYLLNQTAEQTPPSESPRPYMGKQVDIIPAGIWMRVQQDAPKQMAAEYHR